MEQLIISETQPPPPLEGGTWERGAHPNHPEMLGWIARHENGEYSGFVSDGIGVAPDLKWSLAKTTKTFFDLRASTED